MERVRLGESELFVSGVCLGTMTFGEQNDETQSHALLDAARAEGVNFFDTAEMYPVAPSSLTYGRSEELIGRWLARNSARRDEVVISTKVVGPSRKMSWIRDGKSDLDAVNIRAAIDASLRRLRTDYVDLYHLHWPSRNVPIFDQRRFDPAAERPSVPIGETLEELASLVRAGKVRYVGISNETPWGTLEFVRVARERGLPHVVSIQNPYNLLNRQFEDGLQEVCFRERVSLLAHSPLAFGVLSGKYLENPRAEGRLTRFDAGWGARYRRPRVMQAAARYVSLAREHGLEPAAMALGFVSSRSFVASTVIGATDTDQLRRNVAACRLRLSNAVLAGIDAIDEEFRNVAQ